MSLDERRMKLHTKLLAICDNVYFQPPSSIQMEYPCFVYDLNDINDRHANNEVYTRHDRYTVTYITKDPFPTEILEAVMSLPYTSLDRKYASDNLHHYVFTTHT